MDNSIIGKTVRLIKMDDRYALPPGIEGIITRIDDIGNIHVNWNNGSKLALVPYVDQFEILNDEV